MAAVANAKLGVGRITHTKGNPESMEREEASDDKLEANDELSTNESSIEDEEVSPALKGLLRPIRLSDQPGKQRDQEQLYIYGISIGYAMFK